MEGGDAIMDIYDMIKFVNKMAPSGDFILDTVTADYAYSIRKLKSTSTYAIRVKRDSDNAELDIGFVGEDLDTSALLSFVGASNGLVITAYNQVDDGLSSNATPPGNPPYIVKAGVLVTANGKPCMDMSTDDRNLVAPITITPPYLLNTIFISDNFGVANNKIWGRDSGDQIDLFFTSSKQVNFDTTINDIISNVESSQRLINIGVYANGSGSYMKVVNDQYNGDLTGLSSSTGWQIGTRFGSKTIGRIAENIVLSSDADYDTLNTNQKSYYSIT